MLPQISELKWSISDVLNMTVQSECKNFMTVQNEENVLSVIRLVKPSQVTSMIYECVFLSLKVFFSYPLPLCDPGLLCSSGRYID